MMINREFAASIKKLMPDKQRESDLNRPVSMWREKDRIRGFPETTMVVIFKTTGCSWYRFSSCSMCGYFNDVSRDVRVDNLRKQIDAMSDALEDTKVLKVFTSGSFLDPQEFPIEARNYFFESIRGKVEHLLVESRTEYITETNISYLRDYGIPIRIAIGLESANDEIMKNSINKGSTFSKFVSAAEAVNKMGYELRTYLLFKPLFLSEEDSIGDMVDSIAKAAPYSTDISVNPMNIQKNTMVEHMWKKGLYRLPRLWSLARILLESRKYGVQVVSYPTGGNKERGIHNDSRDLELLQLIYNCSLDQDFSDLEKYYNAADRTAYLEYLSAEDTNLYQPDLEKLVRRTADASVLI